MIDLALLPHSLFYGLILSALMTFFVFGSLSINPEMWLHDAPPEIQKKHGPISATAKRQRAWVATFIFSTLILFTLYSCYQIKRVVGGEWTFATLFTHLFVLFMTFNVVDLLLIDWLIIETIRPAFAFRTRLGQLMTERNYWFHFQGFLKGSLGILIASLLIAGITVNLNVTRDSEPIFRLITLFVLMAAISISVFFRHRAEREGGGMRSHEGQKVVVVLRLLGLLVLLPLFGYLLNPNWVMWARFSLPEAIRWLAALIAIGLLPMLYWVFSSIGNNISPTQATRQTHQLVTHGPYRWIRHPLYSFGFVLILSLTLISGLWWLAAAMLLPMAILVWRTSLEEARLIETFGDAYRDYMRQTGRFWPRLSH